MNIPSIQELVKGDKALVAKVLAFIETDPHADKTIDLLSDAWKQSKGYVIGITGPPGVGKSTLTSALVAAYRAQDKTVGVIAVDPSSKESGGALLGDRTRIITDPEDKGAFVRSMAARDQLGGLAALSTATMVLMRAIYDIVLVETVGVGQSETDISDISDTTIFCVQPGSGDSLQFMKAGIMEVPHIAVVTKGDLGASARRALADLEGAIGLSAERSDEWQVPTLVVSSQTDSGVSELLTAIESHHDWLGEEGRLKARRLEQSNAWVSRDILDRFGRIGLTRVQDRLRLDASESPFQRQKTLSEALR